MKKALFSFLLFMLCYSSQGQVSIKVHVVNAPSNALVKLYSYNNKLEYKEIIITQKELAKNGTAQLQAIIPECTMAYISVAQQQAQVFICPTDNFTLDADYNTFDASLSYSGGQGAANNQYLANEQREDFKHLANSYYKFSNADKFAQYVDSIEHLNHAFFEKHQATLSPYFISEHRHTLNYRFINPRWMYKIGFDKEKNTFYEKELPAHYFNFLKNLNINDQAAAENSDYQSALGRHLDEYATTNYGKDTVKKNQTDAEFQQTLLRNYNFRKNNLKGAVRDYQLSHYLYHNVTNFNSDPNFGASILADYYACCSNSTYKELVTKAFERNRALQKGMPAPDFNLYAKGGQINSLATFKGKKVYIDFWATWCLPCIAAMKNSAPLVEKLNGRNDVIMVYINVDDDKKAWETYLEKNKPEGIHLYANKEQSEKLHADYNFRGIPHYSLIGKDGKIINANAAQASQTDKVLKELE